MPMTLDDFLAELRRQPVWSRGSQRAPNKSLAVLYALGQLRQGRMEIPYATGAAAIGSLLERFGPPREHHHPSQPIWRLRPRAGQSPASAIWRVSMRDGAPIPEQDNPPEAELRQAGVFALSDEAIALFTRDPASLDAAATAIAESIVPETLRDELLDAVTGDFLATDDPAPTQTPDTLQPHRRIRTYRIQRDPRFARTVLEAYGHRCAVCQASPRLGDACFGIEAAHIRWVQYDGPNVVANGLCLCRMHHVALDRGAFTIEDGGRVRVSPLLDQSPQSQRLCWDHDGAPIHAPRDKSHAPHRTHCEWHRNEVFRGMPSTA